MFYLPSAELSTVFCCCWLLHTCALILSAFQFNSFLFCHNTNLYLYYRSATISMLLSYSFALVFLTLSSSVRFSSSVYFPSNPTSLQTATDQYHCLNTNPLAFSAISSTRRTSIHSLHSPLITASLLLAGDIHPHPGPSSSKLSIFYLNIRSLLQPKRPSQIFDITDSLHPDLICLTETWVTPDTSSSCLADVTPSGYSLFSFPSSIYKPTLSTLARTLGGGTAFLVREPFSAVSLSSPTYSSFDVSSITLQLLSSKLTVFNIYRRPSSSVHSQKLSTFFDQFQTFLTSAATTPHEFIITGDFNFHIDDHTDSSSQQFASLLSSFNLSQHVNFPTHNLGHTLDLVILPTSSCLQPLIATHPVSPSDHTPLLINLTISPLPPVPPQLRTFRNFRSFNIDDYISDLSDSRLITCPPNSLGSLLIAYDTTLHTLLDKHAPFISKLATHPSHSNPWFTPALRAFRSVRRSAANFWKRTRSSEALSKLKTLTNKYHRLLHTAKKCYFSNLISSNAQNPRHLWKAVNKILHRTARHSLPSSSPSKSLPDSFASFFTDKIDQLRLAFTPSNTSNPHLPSPPSLPPDFSSFTPATDVEILKLINLSPNKQCDLDPIPTWLLKKCLPVLLPTITRIVNLSLSSGNFPSSFKHSIVTPLLKKPSLDKENLNNYRPISNLSFLSKLTERIVKSRLSSHLTSNSLLNPFQSAYTKYHSTETVLLSLFDKLITAIGSQQASCLCLLDLSAAFDTIDHNILLHRLSSWFGISGTALKWFHSYLSSRSFSVHCTNLSSSSHISPYGVPQGSVLGPILFILYTTPLSHLISSLSTDHHLYADDTQLFLSFTPTAFQHSINHLQSVLQEVSNWMSANLLTLNPAKTEFLLIGLPQQLAKIPHASLSPSSDTSILPSVSARNLGFIFDIHLDFSKQISALSRSCFLHIRDLRRIRPSLDHKTACTIATALVHSKLDYCNSLYYNLPKYQLARLQHIQNALARAVVFAPKFCHVTPIIKSLHWLKIPQRIEYKICSISFKTLHTSKPVYLRNLLHIQPPGSTRSSSCLTLSRPPSTSRVKATSRSFRHAAPFLFNSLPHSLRPLPAPHLPHLIHPPQHFSLSLIPLFTPSSNPTSFSSPILLSCTCLSLD